ncbi:MAG TPA: DUF4203 domain-containing protein [Desulfobacterales bacterium]
MDSMIHIALGIVVLACGHRLFWIFVGGVGFVVGFHLALLYFAGLPGWAHWAIALVLGCGGALLALFFQGLAILLAGFAAGGYIALYLTTLAGISDWFWIYPLGGVIGALLLYLLFDWALIFLSSIAGATLIVQSIQWGHLFELLLYSVLVVCGVAFQTTWMLRRRSRPKPG